MKTKGRRQSANIEDLRGRNAQVQTTAKSPRLHPMGAKFVSGMHKIEAVNKYARRRGFESQLQDFIKKNPGFGKK